MNKSNVYVCLNMIVKNESHVIERCLKSVAPFITHYYISDTGSNDGTQEIIRNFCKKNGIIGMVEDEPWKNFEYNRNFALETAKKKIPEADYFLIIDADEILKPVDLNASEKWFKTIASTRLAGYDILTNYNSNCYNRLQLINAKLSWRWIGVLHEVLGLFEDKVLDVLIKTNQRITFDNAINFPRQLLPMVQNVPSPEGARSKDPEKYVKDAKLLQEEHERYPNDARTCFYLAQSYRDSNNLSESLKYYIKRAEMKGWIEEVYRSWLECYRLELRMNAGKITLKTFDYLYKALESRPSRPEAYYELVSIYRKQNFFHIAMILLDYALNLPKTNDVLFVEAFNYDWGFLFEESICCFYLGKYERGLKACQELEKRKSLQFNIPQDVINQNEKNKILYEKKIKELLKNDNESNLTKFEKIKLNKLKNKKNKKKG